MWVNWAKHKYCIPNERSETKCYQHKGKGILIDQEKKKKSEFIKVFNSLENENSSTKI